MNIKLKYNNLLPLSLPYKIVVKKIMQTWYPLGIMKFIDFYLIMQIYNLKIRNDIDMIFKWCKT